MEAPKTSRRRLTVNRKYDMPLMLPTNRDKMKEALIRGRMDLSYDPMRVYQDVDLDSDMLDLEMEIREFKTSDRRFCVTMNILEDWRVIDEAVKESECDQANKVIERIRSKR